MEEKRGTAKLNKRLQREKRSKVTEEDSVAIRTEVSEEELDRQIEHSMKVFFFLFHDFNIESLVPFKKPLL